MQRNSTLKDLDKYRMSDEYGQSLNNEGFGSLIGKYKRYTYPYEIGNTCTITTPGFPGAVRILHFTETKHLETLLKDGLKSRTLLEEEGLLPKLRRPHPMLEYENENIYFLAPQKKGNPEVSYNKALLLSEAWIAIDVDPYSTYVFNSKLREGNTPYEYKYQRITLAKWLQLREAACRRQSRDQGVYINPFTGEPQLMVNTNPEVNGLKSKWKGPWEIVFSGQMIPSTLFADNSQSYMQRNNATRLSFPANMANRFKTGTATALFGIFSSTLTTNDFKNQPSAEKTLRETPNLLVILGMAALSLSFVALLVTIMLRTFPERDRNEEPERAYRP